MISGFSGTTYKDKLLELGIQYLSDRRLRFNLIQTYKIIHGKENVKLNTWLQLVDPIRTITTRQSVFYLNIQPKRTNLEIRNKFFSNCVVETWNKLPNNIKDAPHQKLFIKSLYEKTQMEMQKIINQRAPLIFYLKYPGVTNTNTNLYSSTSAKCIVKDLKKIQNKVTGFFFQWDQYHLPSLTIIRVTAILPYCKVSREDECNWNTLKRNTASIYNCTTNLLEVNITNQVKSNCYKCPTPTRTI